MTKITHVNPGAETYSTARKFGSLLAEQMRKDSRFYFFSPDETTSNKLDEVYQVSERLWNLPTENWDLPESANGRIVELLSENTLFAAMVGHILNGEQAAMASYEAFFEIIASQILQQIKFFKQSEETKWRPAYPAINLLSTSMCWRQDHNGFSHQSPALISTLLSVPSKKVNCFFPADDVAAAAIWRFMMKSQNVVNLTTFDKNPTPRWMDSAHAKYLVEEGGASIYGFASDDKPELVFTAAGDIPTREALAAIKLLRDYGISKPMRFVGINSLIYGAIGTTERQLTQAEFNERFTSSTPIIAAFHGYPTTLESILKSYITSPRTLHTHGFEEEGSTTTPFEMLCLNHSSRYDLAADAAELIKRPDLVKVFRDKIAENHQHAIQFGVDLPENS